MWSCKISFTFAVEESAYHFRLLYTQLFLGLLLISVNMGWESSLMSWFDIGKLVEGSSLLLVVGSVLVGFTTAFIAVGATGALTLAVVFGVAVVASLVGVTSVSFLSTLVVFCVVSFAFVCLSLSCVVSWPCVGSGASAFLTGSAARTNFFRVVTPLAGITSLPTLVVFCVVSFAFVCLPLSCVVSWPCVGFLGFVATTFSLSAAV